MMKKLILVGILFQLSCGGRFSENMIDVKYLKLIFIDQHNNKNFYQERRSLLLNDTILLNNKFDFASSIQNLKMYFNKVDSLATNRETKDYTKLMLLAEWIYGNFNTQFWGDKLGLTNALKNDIDFYSTPLKTCYDSSNSNFLATSCGDRTNLFIRLADSLLKIKCENISIRSVHTFPLAKIGGLLYITDPYDPFLLLDIEKQIVVDYATLKRNPQQNIIAIRTKRSFGEKGELISKNLHNKLKLQHIEKIVRIEDLISNYLLKNKYSFVKRIDSCSYESQKFPQLIYPIHAQTNAFVVYPMNGIENQIIKNSRLLKFYLGINCKTK
jgi:hypothetical protein